MYGNIKQVIELRPDRKPKGDKPQLVPYDTTLFDRMGDPIRTTMGGKGYSVLGYIIRYDTKYDSSKRRVQTTVYTETKTIYSFDNDDSVIKREEPGPTQPLSSTLYSYNSVGEISSYKEYDYYNVLRSTATFEYDLNGFLDHRSYNGNYPSITYKYLSFDAVGNWTKRIKISNRGGIDTVTRKITYY
ncbi:MAG: hypothetical protein JO080_06295 [Mucilaginibacter sp.]|nr:hypothetical protein [Mucilaginibacter sp.]